MPKALLVLIVLVPVFAWGGDSQKYDERKAAEEDICYARLEYIEANRAFSEETGGMYRPGSTSGRYARNQDLKRLRVMQLEKRYTKRFGQPFKGDCQ